MKLPDLTVLCQQLGLDPLSHGLQLVSADELAHDYFPRLDTDRPALVLNLGSALLAQRVKRTLRVNYPKAHPVTLVRGTAKEALTLDMLTRAKRFTRAAVLYVPPLPLPSSPQTVAELMAHLRAPNGCPWDREQTHASLRRALLEEAHEVIEAINENDLPHLREELGDLLLHVLFQTQMAREENAFSLADVGAELAAKLIRRHPHVFGEERASDAQWVLQNWEKIKQQERAAKGEKKDAALDANLPPDLPALIRAQKVYSRAKRAAVPVSGGDGIKAVTGKIKRARNKEQALGEALWELAGWAEENGLDAENALGAATRRVARGKK